MSVAEIRKAIAAFLLAFLGPIGVVLAATDQPLDWRVVVSAVISGLVAGLTTYAVPNAPASPVVDNGPQV